MGNTGAQMGGWYRKEVKSVADMKGLKMRIWRLRRQGARAHRARYRRTSRAARSTPPLEKGTIDAAEWWARTTT